MANDMQFGTLHRLPPGLFERGMVLEQSERFRIKTADPEDITRQTEIEFLNNVMNTYQRCDKPYYPIEIFDTPECPAPTQIEVRRLGDIAQSKAVLVSLSVRGWPDLTRRAQLEAELCRLWTEAGLTVSTIRARGKTLGCATVYETGKPAEYFPAIGLCPYVTEEVLSDLAVS
jgi:hypothetical protein